VEARSVIPGVKRVMVAGIPVDVVREEDFDSVALTLIEDGAFHQIVFLSLWDLMRARRDKDFRLCVERASLVVPISMGILKGAKFLKREIPVRYMPFDFVIRFFSVLESKGKSLYLLGSEMKYLQNAEQNLRQTFPGMKIVGRYTGFYPKSMERNILVAIKKASPHFILVGSGIRGREKWIHRGKSEFNQGVFLYSSLTLDIFSGKRRKVSRETFQKGREFYPDLVRRPWRVFRSVIYAYYGLLLLIHRLRKA